MLLLCRNYAGYYLFQILLTDDAGSNTGFDAGFVPSLMPDFFSSLCWNDDAEYVAGFNAGYVPSLCRNSAAYKFIAGYY